MQKAALSLAVIALSGGYVLLQPPPPANELVADSAAPAPQAEAALAPQAEPALTLPPQPAVASVESVAPQPVIAPVSSAPPPPPPVLPATVAAPARPFDDDEDENIPAPRAATVPFPAPRPKILEVAAPAPAPTVTSTVKVTKVSAPVKVAAATTGRFADGTWLGPAANAYYGLVQVRAHVSGGNLISVEILQYPSDRRTSVRINRYALPILIREAVANQTGNVDSVSGATLTSNAYRQSLVAALSQAVS